MKSIAAHLEPLESRIAPAVVVSYIDVDGDIVRITDSSNTLTLANLALAGGQLQELDLTAAGFAGADISFSVVRRPGGDGLAHVGFIDAGGNDLGRVSLKGDLGRIVVGDATPATAALESLSAWSIGGRGLTTQDVGGSLNSVITGGVGKLSVRGSILEANLAISGALTSLSIGRNLVGGETSASGTIVVQGALGSVSIGGGIVGGTGDDSGCITSATSIGNVTIGRNIVGGAGDRSGVIDSDGTLGKVRIGVNLVGGAGDESGRVVASGAASDLSIKGSVIGGSGVDSGAVRAGSLTRVAINGDLLGREGEASGTVSTSAGGIGAVRIGGNVNGGEGPESGSIDSATTLGDVRIGRGLIGDAGPGSGRLRSAGDMGDVTIGGDVRGGTADGTGLVISDTGDIGRVKLGGWLVGGSISAAGTLTDTGIVRAAAGNIESVSMGGSLFAGSATGGGLLLRSGGIFAGEALGPVSVGGALLGNSTNAVHIVATGQAAPGAEDVAIASVTVRGDAVYAQILAGFDSSLQPANADASIGTVRVVGDWIAGSIVAGAEDGLTPGYGLGDVLQTVSDGAQIARIAAIRIDGFVRGTGRVTTDHFGFVSERIDSLRIRGVAVALTVGGPPDNILIAGTNDVRVLEV